MNVSSQILHEQSIAIVGMAGRFSSANSVDELWALLKDGRDSLRWLSDQALRSAGVSEAQIADPGYVKAEMAGPDGDQFDAAIFGFSERQAASIDPQQRLFLECAWEAMENAGYCTDYLDGSVGVFAGSGTSFHLFEILASLLGGDGIDMFQAIIDADKDYLATRVSYKLGLTGPSLSVQTACSTSLVAVHLAAQSLLGFECDMALAGGVSLSPRPGTGYMYVPGGVASSDGHCRAYDAGATGMAMGSGAGVVAMKRLCDAVADGDNIHAVIRATVINNDGSDKVGFTAPGLRAQTRLVATAVAMAGVEPEAIGMIEGHGTGTELGDMIELTALHEVFSRPGRSRYCALGSVKTNIGHLDTASGVTGLIKAALCLKNRTFVPSLHFEQPNSVLELPETPFFVPTVSTPWEARDNAPRLAGVSSLGIGGTNAHAILEEPPARVRRHSDGVHLFPLSAADPAALQDAARNLAGAVSAGEEDLADIAFTLQVGRKPFAYRAAVAAGSKGQLADRLARLKVGEPTETGGQTLFLFPSRTRNLTGVAHRLYEDSSSFRRDLDLCALRFEEALGRDVRTLLCEGVPDDDDGSAAAALFALEYGVGRQWLDWGLKPDAFLGEGLGEVAAACVAGAISLEDGIDVVAAALRERGMRGEDGAPAASKPSKALSPAREMETSCAPCFSLDRGELVGPVDLEQWSRELLAPGPGLPSEAGFPGARRVLEILPETGLVGRIKATAALKIGGIVRGPADGCPLDRAELLDLLGDMWCSGAAIDWLKLHGDESRRRVALPTYAFQRQRCALDRLAPAAPGQRASGAVEPSERRPAEDWLYVPSFATTPNPGPPGADVEGKTFLLFAEEGLARHVAPRLQALGGTVLVVEAGAEFREEPDRFVIRPAIGEDYEQLFDTLGSRDFIPDGVIHSWSVSESPDEAVDDILAEQARGYVSLLLLMQAWQARQPECAKLLLAVTSGLYDVAGEGGTRPAAGTLAPLCMVISQEQPEARCSVLDLPDGGRSEAFGKYADWIIAEAVRPGSEIGFAYRGNRRLKPAYEPVRLDGPPVRSIRNDGVYLLIGGLGGIGLALALHLSRTYQARVAIVSRTALPPRDEWQKLVEAGRHPQRTTLERLLEVERAGGMVFVTSGDVGSVPEMTRAVEQVERAFGRLNGVYHLAMAQDSSVGRMWQDVSPGDLASQLKPKLGGFRVLTEVFQHRKIDFGVAFSSTSSALGGFGFAAYAAGNAALESAVLGNQPAMPRWLCVNWGGWRVLKPSAEEAGVADGAGVAAIQEDPDTLGSEEGCRVLDAIVTRSTVPRLLVNPTRLEERLAIWARHRSEPEPAMPADTIRPSPTGSGANLHDDIVELLKSSLGVEDIRNTDMFIDLGGNSLIGLRVQFRVQKRFGVTLPPRLLMEKPLVPGVVEHVRLALEEAG